MQTVREGILYTLQEHHMFVDNGSEIHYYQPPNLQKIRCGGEAIIAHTVNVPIHHVRKLDEDIFFALDPRLAEILETPYKLQVAEIAESKRLLIEEKRQVMLKYLAEHKVANELAYRIAVFTQLPWWKRVWEALRSKI